MKKYRVKKYRVKKSRRYIYESIALLALIVALIIVGGACERGYVWPASEMLVIPVGILLIVETWRTTYGIKKKKRHHERRQS